MTKKYEFLFNNITAVTMREDEPVLRGAQIGIQSGKIAYIGTGASGGTGRADSSALAASAVRVIDGTGKVLMPGLYNTHAHIPMTLLRGYADDLNLEEWLFDKILPAEQRIKELPGAVRAGALLAMAEMLASGTVAFNDMYFQMDIVAQAVEESGMKANLCNAVVNFDDDYNILEDACYHETLRVLDGFAALPHGRIKADASIHGVYTSTEKAWRQVVDFAQSRGIRMQVHLSESKTEHENCIAKHGLTPAQVFDKFGVFSCPATAAHACWVSDEDMAILRANGVSVAHNPVSNLKLASGIAPVAKMLERGLNVTMGTDGAASNNTNNLFEEIKLAAILQKCAAGDPTVLPARQVLEMATVNGAKSQGREGGQIAVGLDADLIMLDFDTLGQVPCYDPLSGLVYSASGRDVALTMCQGRILYENGEHKTIDIEQVKFQAGRLCDDLYKSR